MFIANKQNYLCDSWWRKRQNLYATIFTSSCSLIHYKTQGGERGMLILRVEHDGGPCFGVLLFGNRKETHLAMSENPNIHACTF